MQNNQPINSNLPSPNRVICPVCGVEGHLQVRGNSRRVGRYRGYSGRTRIVEWHRLKGGLNGKQSLVNKNLNLGFKSEKVAGGEGFEPSTPNLGGWCSIRTELLAHANSNT